MTIKEVVDSIAGQFNEELNHVFKEKVKTNVLIARAEAIRQYADKYNTLPSSLINAINCIPTKVVDAAECCSVEIDCEVIRTTNKVPSSIRVKGLDTSFTYVGAIDGKHPYSAIQPEELPFLLADRFTKKQAFYAYVNGYIYIFNKPSKNIKVRGIFNDPEEVYKLNDCDNGGTGCADILDIPTDLVNVIKSIVFAEMRNVPVNQDNEEVKTEEDVNR